MSEFNHHPIGVFDSGLGGLTVIKAITQVLPNENFIYFGDTAHLPYGDKSKETIVRYVTGITDFLMHENCKVIVIACNSASANAYSEITERTGNQIPVLNVIDPVVDFVSNTDYNSIGVIGTKSTIDTNVYAEKINRNKNDINVSSMATPLLVPMIEEGFIFDDISNAIIRNYLSRREIMDIEALVLGCTHYPIISNQISKFYDFNVDIINSAKIVADSLFRLLSEKNLLNAPDNQPTRQFFVSDFTPYFKLIGRMFFEEDIELKHLKLPQNA